MVSSDLLPQLIRIAHEAGEAILNIYNRAEPLQVEHKHDSTPVTEADLAAHTLICSSLERLTPEIPVLSEESDDEQINSRRSWSQYWLVDPLDGTKEFIKRNGEFTVNIALIEHHKPVLGVVYAPAIQATYAGCVTSKTAYKCEGGKSHDRQKAIQTRPLTPFRPLALVVSRSHRDPAITTYIDKLKQLTPLSETPMGSSLKLCLIAEGMADLHLRVGPTSEWDTAAAHAVLEAAGGQVTDLKGVPLRYNSKESLLNPDFMASGDCDFNWQRCFNS